MSGVAPRANVVAVALAAVVLAVAFAVHFAFAAKGRWMRLVPAPVSMRKVPGSPLSLPFMKIELLSKVKGKDS